MRFVEPKQAVSQFHIRDGDSIGDFGAGSGFFTKELSAAAGDGKVYALEIQKPLITKIAEQARVDHLNNVEVVWCDLEAEKGTKLSDGALDVAVMVNVLFQLEDKNAALREVARVLRSGGKFFVIDWTESFGGMGPAEDAVVSRESAEALVLEHGFSLDRDFPTGDHHYGLAFRKK